jgi:hypothetical protein
MHLDLASGLATTGSILNVKNWGPKPVRPACRNTFM